MVLDHHTPQIGATLQVLYWLKDQPDYPTRNCVLRDPFLGTRVVIAEVESSVRMGPNSKLPTNRLGICWCTCTSRAVSLSFNVL